MEASELERRLAEVEALRRRVLNVIPHALRTPITTFRGLAEALPAATESQIREEIAPALRRLAGQVEHLLDDMLIAAGYTTALPTGDIVRAPVLETVRAVWGEVGAGHQLDVEGDDAVEVTVPEGSLFKMLVHVLDNAATYGESPRSASVRREGDRVVVEVATAGPDAPDTAMFAEPFYRGERAVMRVSGLGVGLTVGKALAEQAGGSLDVRPGPDGGVVTRLELAAA